MCIIYEHGYLSFFCFLLETIRQTINFIIAKNLKYVFYSGNYILVISLFKNDYFVFLLCISCQLKIFLDCLWG